MPRGRKPNPNKINKTSFSIRLDEDKRLALQAIADNVGFGCTPTNVILQAITDIIEKHKVK